MERLFENDEARRARYLRYKAEHPEETDRSKTKKETA